VERLIHYREYWHPGETQTLASRDRVGQRCEQCVSMTTRRLPELPTVPDEWCADVGGPSDVLDKYKLRRQSPPFNIKCPSHAELSRHLQNALAEMEADGWVETEFSKSVRVFLNTTGTANKFWTIALDENKHQIHNGRADQNGGWSWYSGKETDKVFPTREKAVEEYHKIIRKKSDEGYVELYGRENEYSKLLVPTKGKG
jgi:predicted DNA-binding WGR domain protein